MANLEMLEAFCQADGVSGYEKEATRVMKSYLEGYCDEIQYDYLGSLVAHKKGVGPKVLLTGHIDEIGFCVKEITEDGYLRVHPLGGWNTRNMMAEPVTITTREGKKLPGIIGTDPKPGWPRDKAIPMEDVYVDLGGASKQEALDLGIHIGDPITPKAEFMVMNNPKYVNAKAWDDRVGAAIVTDVMRNMAGKTLACDLYCAGTVQEEVGCRGAKTVGQMVMPDLSIAIDVGGDSDTPNAPKGKAVLGSGAAICVRDNSFIAHYGLLWHMEKICEEHQIPYTTYVLGYGGTDSGEMSKVGAGSINLTISIPSRHIHSHNSMIHLDDYDAIVALLSEFVKTFDQSVFEKLKECK